MFFTNYYRKGYKEYKTTVVLLIWRLTIKTWIFLLFFCDKIIVEPVELFSRHEYFW